MQLQQKLSDCCENSHGCLNIRGLLNGQSGEEVMKRKMINLIRTNDGKVGVPILMWLLGVPGFVCVLAWLFFFKG